MLGPTIIDPNDEHPKCKKCGNSFPLNLRGEDKCPYCGHKFVVDESLLKEDQAEAIEENKTSIGSINIPLDILSPEIVNLLKDIKKLMEDNLKVNSDILEIISKEKKIIDLHRRFRS